MERLHFSSRPPVAACVPHYPAFRNVTWDPTGHSEGGQNMCLLWVGPLLSPTYFVLCVSHRPSCAFCACKVKANPASVLARCAHLALFTAESYGDFAQVSSGVVRATLKKGFHGRMLLGISPKLMLGGGLLHPILQKMPEPSVLLNLLKRG